MLLESRRQIRGVLNYDILHSFLYLLCREVFEVPVCKHVSKAHHLVVISVRIQQSTCNSRLRIYSISLRACTGTQYASCRLQGTLTAFNTCQQRYGQHVCKDIFDNRIPICIFNKPAEQPLPYSILCLYSFRAEDIQSLSFLLQRLLAPSHILCLLYGFLHVLNSCRYRKHSIGSRFLQRLFRELVFKQFSVCVAIYCRHQPGKLSLIPQHVRGFLDHTIQIFLLIDQIVIVRLECFGFLLQHVLQLLHQLSDSRFRLRFLEGCSFDHCRFFRLLDSELKLSTDRGNLIELLYTTQ